jgi:hypothetical protein
MRTPSGLGFKGSIYSPKGCELERRTKEKPQSWQHWTAGWEIKSIPEALWEVSTWGFKSEEQKKLLSFKLWKESRVGPAGKLAFFLL